MLCSLLIVLLCRFVFVVVLFCVSFFFVVRVFVVVCCYLCDCFLSGPVGTYGDVDLDLYLLQLDLYRVYFGL